ncbi:hypothetical protein [Antarcticirhabdus aurantiaca]|uniref:hypothetical protein n=1 Tax=Antarcticirhabdus aurantiaca TaxID=2606717 RepID=UPI00131E3695|nr:hypothetical protein [Antarcticirhabdus aurantiaca]
MTEDTDIDRWLDGEFGWPALADRLGLTLAEAARIRRAARTAAIESLTGVRLARRAASGEALAQQLLAERTDPDAAPAAVDEALAERIRRMRGGGS